MSLLELKNISKIYGDLHALDNVSLNIEKGEWIAIMGPSGSGKSTMMNIIGCLDRPTTGEVIFDGKDISRESRRRLTELHRDKIGLVFQQFHLLSPDLIFRYLNIFSIGFPFAGSSISLSRPARPAAVSFRSLKRRTVISCTAAILTAMHRRSVRWHIPARRII